MAMSMLASAEVMWHELTMQVPWFRQGFDKQWYIRSWQFVPCQPGGQEQVYPPRPSLRQVPPFWHGVCRSQGRRSNKVRNVTINPGMHIIIINNYWLIINQFLPTSQRLPAYPERQIHSFASLQNPPTGAIHAHNHNNNIIIVVYCYATA